MYLSIETIISFAGPKTSLYAGLYDFAYPATAPPSERTVISARFSFTYTRDINGDWLITEHHSSALPQGDERNGKSIAEPRAPSK